MTTTKKEFSVKRAKNRFSAHNYLQIEFITEGTLNAIILKGLKGV